MTPPPHTHTHPSASIPRLSFSGLIRKKEERKIWRRRRKKRRKRGGRGGG